MLMGTGEGTLSPATKSYSWMENLARVSWGSEVPLIKCWSLAGAPWFFFRMLVLHSSRLIPNAEFPYLKTRYGCKVLHGITLFYQMMCPSLHLCMAIFRMTQNAITTSTWFEWQKSFIVDVNIDSFLSFEWKHYLRFLIESTSLCLRQQLFLSPTLLLIIICSSQ